ncbi:predicted protein [Histoplasma mississippiense (nom. inval.)]|uniref:predicted protein n=1 Tax=Ajellomyces capsulatus (strain NAm1 / WU24) TaxID=2059318 RepID=UPI000157CA13|nr:predicted protein [Histoplasma mississippiense (nom. inval.)]EDN09716.1 predicted protein [Histoplasma mississippiense (nom. inval.)]
MTWLCAAYTTLHSSNFVYFSYNHSIISLITLLNLNTMYFQYTVQGHFIVDPTIN